MGSLIYLRKRETKLVVCYDNFFLHKHAASATQCLMFCFVFQDYEQKLRQDLRNLSTHTAILTGRINALKMVPALFGVVDF